MRRAPYKGAIPCEFAGCSRVIGGSSKSGMFSNYNSHVLAMHDHGTAPRKTGRPIASGARP